VEFDGSTVLLQWAVGGMWGCWVTTRRREVGLGYGWLLRGIWAALAIGAVALGEWWAVPVAVAILAVLVRSTVRREEGAAGLPSWLDLVPAVVGLVALVPVGIDAGDPAALALARTLAGAAFLGTITDAMLLGHWYLVQPGLSREPLLELIRLAQLTWPFEVLFLLWPTGMVSVLDGTIDDGYSGTLGWFWVASAVTTIVLLFVTRAALREREYSAVMAATGLLYLAILTAAGTDLVARAVLAT
jgi:hypothetical protein